MWVRGTHSTGVPAGGPGVPPCCPVAAPLRGSDLIRFLLTQNILFDSTLMKLK